MNRNPKNKFVPGDPKINRAGRPKGSVEHSWYNLRWWHKLILDNYEKLTDVQKVELGLKGLSMLVAKLPSIPATPSESVQRVVDVHGELEKAESNEKIGEIHNTAALENTSYIREDPR